MHLQVMLHLKQQIILIDDSYRNGQNVTGANVNQR